MDMQASITPHSMADVPMVKLRRKQRAVLFSLLGRTVAWRFAEIREWTRSRPNAHFVDERERHATRDLSPQSPAGQREPLAAPRGARRA